MRISEVLTIGLLQATAVLASPYDVRNAKVVSSKRPNHPVAPHHPGKTFPASPARTKTCIVQACGNGTDDSANILKAIKQCNNGGHVVFPKDQKFTIGTALDLTFLNHIDLGRRQFENITADTKANTNQISKERSSSPMTRLTGKRTASTKRSRMRPLSSSLEVMMLMCTAEERLMVTAKLGMISTPRTSTSYALSCSAPLASRAEESRT
jgi:hypothetical protein